MAMKKLKKITLLAASIVFAGTLTAGVATMQVSANEPGWNDLSLTMTQGAWARLSTESGLRFKATLTNYDESDNVKYGVIIVPVDYMTGMTFNDDYVEKLDEEYGAGNYINAQVKPTKDTDGATDIIQHSITSIKTGNYDREFFGIAYATDGTTYKYATSNDNERSITYIASCALNDLHYNENLDTEKKTLYQTYQEDLENFVKTGVKNATGDDTTPPFEITGDTTPVAVNETIDLGVKMREGVNLACDWISADESIATVDKTGLVTMKELGKTTITARIAGLYEQSVEVTAMEEGAIAPFNSKQGDKYVTSLTNLGVEVNDDENFTHDNEKYSLKVEATEKTALFHLQNCLTDINAQDSDGNYLYNYFRFYVYLATEETVVMDINNTDTARPSLTYGKWTEIKAVRNGNTFTLNGVDLFKKDGYTTVQSKDMRLRFLSDDKNTTLYISAIRAGYDEIYEEKAEGVVAAFHSANATNYAKVRSSLSLALNVDGAYTYGDEAHSLKVTTSSTSATLNLQNCLTDINAKDGDGKYLYDYFHFYVYLATTTTAAIDINFHSTTARTSLVYDDWTEVKAVRNGNTFTLNGVDMFTHNDYKTVQSENMCIRFVSGNTNTTLYISAIRAGKQQNESETVAYFHRDFGTSQVTSMNDTVYGTPTFAYSTDKEHGGDGGSLQVTTVRGGSSQVAGTTENRMELVAPSITDVSTYDYIYFYVYTDCDSLKLTAINSKMKDSDLKTFTAGEWNLVKISKRDNGTFMYGNNTLDVLTTAQASALSLNFCFRYDSEEPITFYISPIRVSNTDPAA